ncbi:flagellar hook capping FlgD N-terminal domain-containing protein [Eubacteriaceae bacterium ES3]|nr:flagellar hook capping FlgD N-terminal domain-containing protein [Eubacteriaceae bacterium ES3]
MAIDSINSYLTTAATTSTTAATTSSGLSSDVFSMDDFMAMMVAQLQNQDMYSSQDSSEFIAQMAQYTMIEAINEMTDAMDDMMELSQTNYGVSLIGKDVTIAEVDSDGNITSFNGTVEGVNFYNGSTQVVVDGTSYNLSSVMSVQAATE